MHALAACTNVRAKAVPCPQYCMNRSYRELVEADRTERPDRRSTAAWETVSTVEAFNEIMCSTFKLQASAWIVECGSLSISIDGTVTITCNGPSVTYNV